MLILVVVIVNVAMNGGLFEKSQEAKRETDKNVEKEQLTSAAVGALGLGANFDIQEMQLPEGAKWISGKNGENIEDQDKPDTNGNWVKTSKGNEFYIDNKGNILDYEPFSITIQVGDNAFATWGDGKLIISGRGATTTFEEGGLENPNEGGMMGLFRNQLMNKLNISEISANLICFYGIGAIAEETENPTELIQMFLNAGVEISQIEQAIILENCTAQSRISEIKFEEGITKIGSHIINNSAMINKLTLPSTLTEIEGATLSETYFTQPVIIPYNITVLGIYFIGYPQQIYMQRKNSQGLTLPNNFENDYIVTWSEN